MKKSIQSCEPIKQTERTFYKKNIPEVLIAVEKFRQSEHHSQSFTRFHQQLSNEILKPRARILGHSKSWITRYLAVLCYEHGYEQQDEANLTALIKDANNLISITASKIAIRDANERLVKAFIEHFSKKRRIKQRAESDILSVKNDKIIPIIEAILEKESDLYQREFCYRILTHFERTPLDINLVLKDLYTSNLDLKIAAIHYLEPIDLLEEREKIYSFAEDEHWQVRAVVAGILGKDRSSQSITMLRKLICDSHYVVRTNAANALVELDKVGIEILKSQSPDEDRYAYEAAQEALFNDKILSKGN